MIIAISSPMADVSLDDEIEGYCPTRTAELVRHCGALYREALGSAVVVVEAGAVDEDED